MSALPQPTFGDPLVVIGLSAGGMEPLSTIIAALPTDFSAAILIAMHMGEQRHSHLPDILARRTGLAVRAAEDGSQLQSGEIYIAPPGAHTTISNGNLIVTIGPRHNGYRPSIDASLFSAASSHHSPVIAVLLSGAGSDGIAGAMAVQASGGQVVIQDPGEALVSTMPRGALERTTPDAILPASEIASWLDEKIRGPAARQPLPDTDEIDWAPTGMPCPDCGGVLWEAAGSQFRCRVGHRWSEPALETISSQQIELGLETALRVLDEQISFDHRLLQRAADGNREGAVRRVETRIRDREKVASELRGLLDRVKSVTVAGNKR